MPAGAPLLAAMLLAVGSPPSATPLRFEIATPEILSLLYTAEALAGEPHRSLHFQALVDPSSDVPRHIDAFRQALAAVPSGYGYYTDQKDLPAGRSFGRGFLELLELRAAQSRDLDDFGSRILGLLPLPEHVRLLEALRSLQPFHRAKIWDPAQDRLKRAKTELEALAARAEAGALLQQVAVFYGARWPEALPFTVALVPVPHGVKNSATFGHSVDALEVVELLEGDDLQRRFGVIIHELAHSLFDAEPLALKQQLQAWFDASPSPARRAACEGFNEAAATAIGNGYAAERAGSRSDHGWYNDALIDAYGHALYPLTVQYLKAGRTIDAAYVDAAVQALGTKVPQGLLDAPATVLRELSLFARTPKWIEVSSRALRASHLVSNLNSSAPTAHPKSIEVYGASHRQTALFLLGPEETEDLDGYPFHAVLAARLRATRKEAAWYLATHAGAPGDDRLKVFVFARDAQALEGALARLIALPQLALDAPQSLSP